MPVTAKLSRTFYEKFGDPSLRSGQGSWSGSTWWMRRTAASYVS